jgi:hypothetical protein
MRGGVMGRREDQVETLRWEASKDGINIDDVLMQPLRPRRRMRGQLQRAFKRLETLRSIRHLELELGIGLSPCPVCDEVAHSYEHHRGVPVIIAWPCCHAFEPDEYPDWVEREENP